MARSVEAAILRHAPAGRDVRNSVTLRWRESFTGSVDILVDGDVVETVHQPKLSA